MERKRGRHECSDGTSGRNPDQEAKVVPSTMDNQPSRRRQAARAPADLRPTASPSAAVAAAPALAAALLLVAALIPGILATADLTWPYDHDHFRDIGVAQTIQEGGWRGWREDPFYAGETAWYNPLIPAIVAVTAAIFQTPVPETFTRIGAAINILPALLFFICARRLIGPVAALPALTAWLFLPHSPPAWGAAMYTPWLFPATAAHALFYGGALAWLRALERPSLPRLSIAGAILGVTLLAHTAPALVLTGIILATALLTPARLSPLAAHGVAGRAKAIAVPGAIAAIIASPFLLPLAMRYGFHVVNRMPGSWTDERLSFTNLGLRLMKPSTWPTSLLTIVGAIDLLRRGVPPVAAATSRMVLTLPTLIMMSWGVITLALFIISTLGQTSALLPVVVPAFHFYFLLRALACLAFGAGFMVMSGVLARWWSRQPAAGQATATSVALVVTLLLSAALYPDYLDREAFTSARRRAIEWQSSDDRRAREWIRANTPPSAVFAAYDDDALRIVGAAGRKVICMDAYFSNPYLDRAPRADARDRLFAALVAGERDKFLEIARSYRVTHVLLHKDRLPTVKLRDVPFLKVYYQHQQVSIASITP
jgi:hypothetical protein